MQKINRIKSMEHYTIDLPNSSTKEHAVSERASMKYKVTHGWILSHSGMLGHERYKRAGRLSLGWGWKIAKTQRICMPVDAGPIDQ